VADNFFEAPILNSPYEYPTQHWELDQEGQPTGKALDLRRGAEFITPIPKPKKRKKSAAQQSLLLQDADLSDKKQQYDATSNINQIRADSELDRATAATEKAGIKYKVLDENVETITGYASISTMHLAKGLEFRAVSVMACDDEVIPLQERIESIADEADLEDVYNTERNLLYVACTRARDHLLVSGVNPASEFLDDFRVREQGSNGRLERGAKGLCKFPLRHLQELSTNACTLFRSRR
jgi:hypothetical protein